MFYKIVGYLFLPLMILALTLSLSGVTYIDPNSTIFMDLLRTTTYRLSAYKIEIPNIPLFPTIVSGQVGADFANAFLGFFNAIITFINLLVLFINIIISVLQFIITFIFVVFDFLKGVPVAPNPIVNQFA